MLVRALFLLCSCLLVMQVSARPAAAQNSDEERIAQYFSANKPRVALVLSGGGARGFAHIGVLDVLDSAHVDIDLIVGTSIGASIGGLYAVGYTPKELERFAVQTNWTEILGLDDEARRTDRRINQKDQDDAILSLRFNGFLEPVLPKGLSNGQRWTMLLNSMVINAPYGIPSDFLRQTKVPFVAVATDIIAGRRKLMTSGDLTAAIRASATWPIMFNPVFSDSGILVDGGLISNVPVDVAKLAGAATVVAVNASSGLKRRDEIENPWDVADQAVTLMMLRQTRSDLENADIIITPDIRSNEFDSIASMIEAGRVAARQMLDRLRFVSKNDPPSSVEDTLLPQLLQLRVYGIDVADSLHTVELLRNGRPVLRSNVHALLEDPIIRLARSRGLSLAQIDSIIFIPRSGRADVFVDPGIIRTIKLEGAPEVHPDVVYRELLFSEGEVFTASGAERGIQNLIGTEIFEFVGLEIVQSGPPDSVRYLRRDSPVSYQGAASAKPSWDIRLTVQPKAANVLRLGVLADNEFGTQFWTELANENLLGSATNFSLKGHLGPQSRRLAMTFNAPRLFRTNATLLVQAFTGYKDIPEFNTIVDFENDVIRSEPGPGVRESKDWGARIRSGGQVGQIAALTIEYRYEQQRSFTIFDRANLELLRVGALRADIVYDTRDDRAYPTQGTYLTAGAETATEFLGSEIGFTKLSGIAEQTISLSRLHKLIPRLSAGFGDLTLPRQEQFALGGIESFYGLNEYEMRGRQMLSGNLTYQIGIPHALFFPTFVAFRYDMGATWLIPQAIKFEALVHGIGVQVGLKTPFGLARFGIGENFRFVSSGDRPVYFNRPRFYFSIGSLTY